MKVSQAPESTPRSSRFSTLVCLLLLGCPTLVFGGVKPDEIVDQHLASIGTPEARAAVKSRDVQGTLTFKVIVGGAGETGGNWERLSEDRKSKFVMKFGDAKWWGEQFVFDGDKASYAMATAAHQWSPLGRFVASQDSLIKDSLLGGELGTAWALENVDHHRVKLDYTGLKKVDGRQLQCIEYLSKSNAGMLIKIYFEPDTHHHVMTVYTVDRDPGVGKSDIATAHQQQIHYTIEERFSDFQTDQGITLPRQYDLRFTQLLENGTTNGYEWKMTADKVLENPSLDPASFQIK